MIWVGGEEIRGRKMSEGMRDVENDMRIWSQKMKRKACQV